MTVPGPVRADLSSLRSTVAAAAAALVMVTGCSVGAPTPPSVVQADTRSSTQESAGQRIVLRFNDGVASAVLTDTPAGRQLAALLPLTVDLRDPMGQAKTGRLPTPIDDIATMPVTDPDAGGIYYVPGGHQLTIFYDDLGQTVPAPGLVRLGTVDDLEVVARQGTRVRVHIDLVDRVLT